MKYIIKKEVLSKVLTLTSRAIDSKVIIAVYASVKISAFKDRLEVLSSNGNMNIKTCVYVNESGDLQVVREGEILINHRLFSEITRKMSGDNIVVDVVDNTLIYISDEKSTFKLNCISADEYPDIDFDDKGVTLNIEQKVYQSFIDQTSFAISQNKGQALVLTAINFELKDSMLTACSTDSYRLARKRIEANTDETFKVNIPTKFFIDSSRMFEGEKDLQVIVNDQRIVVKSPTCTTTSSLIVGEYPNVEKIIPTKPLMVLEISSKELLSALERASIINIADSRVKIHISEEEFKISSKSSVYGSTVENIDSYAYQGNPLQISFKANHVVEAIRALSSEDVVVEFWGEMKAFIVRSKTNEGVTHLITALRSQH